MVLVFCIAVFLIAVSQFMDFVYQLDQHGWWQITVPNKIGEDIVPPPTILKRWFIWLPRELNLKDNYCIFFARLKRGKKWGFWDFIPHDRWHYVQSIRNTSKWVGFTVLGYWSNIMLLAAFPTLGDTELVFCMIAVAGTIYAIMRGVYFTLAKEILS